MGAGRNDDDFHAQGKVGVGLNERQFTACLGSLDILFRLR